MPKITVEIELDTDTGQVMVGLEPPEAEAAEAGSAGQPGAPGAEAAESYMQPANSLDDALSTAKDLLSGQTGAQAQQANADSDMAAGYSSVRGGGLNGAQPQGQP